MSLGIPKRPSLEQQNEHNLTHFPFAGWCQACLSTRAKEEVHKRDVKKDVESSKTVISFDFGYTYVGDYGNEKSPEEVKDADEQYGTVLYIADHHTKAVHAVPVMRKGAPNLKLMVEELVRFGTQVAGGDPVIYQSDGERSTKQLPRAVQHCRANLGLETEIRISGVQQHASNGQAEGTVQSVRRLAKLFEALSPSKRRGVDEFNVDEITVMPHGDTNVWDEIEGIAELDLNDWGPEKADGLETVDDEMQIMEFDQEEIQKMDEKTEDEEIARLKAMPAMTELQPHEENDYSDITTKMVITWKKREEKGGWFRRARLVARQFRWSVDVEESFAPTSLMAIPRMLLHLAACCPQHYGVQVIDVKDAFLMVPQPEEERASVTYNGMRYKLVRRLPGQRAAANNLPLEVSETLANVKWPLHLTLPASIT